MATGKVSDWSTDDVTEFLRKLEVDAVVDDFKRNAVNGRDLLKLSDDDLANDLKLSNLQIRKIRRGLDPYMSETPAPAEGSVVGYVKDLTTPPGATLAEGYPAVPQQYALEASMPASAAAAMGTGVGAAGLVRGFRAQDLQDYISLQQGAQVFEVQQVEGKSSSETARVRQLEGRLATERQQLAKLQQDMSGSKEKLAKYKGDKWFPLKSMLKDGKIERYQSELDSQTAALQSVEASIGQINKELEAARSQASDLAGQAAQLTGLRQRKDALQRQMLTAWAAADPHAALLSQQSMAINTEYMQAKQISDSYASATQELKGALSELQQALQTLERSNMVATVGMVGAVARRGPGRPLGAALPLSSAVNMMDVRRANDLTKSAGMRLHNAQRRLPTKIPYIPSAEIKSAAAGVFTSFLVGGVMGGMVQKMQIRSSMANVQAMAQHVNQAVSWIEPKTMQYVGETNRLNSLYSAKDSEARAYQQTAFGDALVAMQT